MKKINKKLIIPMIILLLGALVAVFYVSYGYVAARITNNELAKKQTFINQKLEIEYSDGTEELISKNTSFIPGSVIEKTFTIKNTGNIKLNFKIKLSDVVNKFIRTDITYELYQDDLLINSSTMPSTDETIAYNQSLEINETKTYTLKIIYNNSEENQIIDQGKIISAKITFEQQTSLTSNIKVLGRSNQESIPTDYNSPVEIQSVGNKVENLLDYSKAVKSSSTQNTQFSYNTDYLDVYSKNMYDYVYIPVSLKANKTYTLWYEYNIYERKEENENSTKLLLGFRITNYNNAISEYKNGVFQKIFKYTPAEDCVVDVLFYVNYGSSNPAKVKIRSMLLEGDYSYDNLPDYVPFNATKYDVPIHIEGKNKIRAIVSNYNANGINFNYNEKDNTFILNGTAQIEFRTFFNSKDHYGLNDFGNIKNKEKYTFSVQPIISKDDKMSSISFGYKINGYEDSSALSDKINIFKKYSIPINVYDDSYIRNFSMHFSKGATFNGLKLKLQYENTNGSTDFEPYIRDTSILLDEPLRSVGNCENCSDYIDLKSGKVVRNVGEYTFTGNESFQLTESNGVHQIYVNDIILGDISNSYAPISNRFKGILNNDITNNYNTIYLVNDGKGIAVNLNNGWTIDDFKDFVTENEVKVLYKLENSVESPLYDDNVYKTNPNYKVDITNMYTINPDYPISTNTSIPAQIVIE